jgi:hypothetical protein
VNHMGEITRMDTRRVKTSSKLFLICVNL